MNGGDRAWEEELCKSVYYNKPWTGDATIEAGV